MLRKNKYILCFSEGNGNYFLCNFINKSVVEIDEEALSLLNRKQAYTSEEKKIIDIFKQHKFLVPENYNELEEIRNLEEFKKQKEISTKFSSFEIIVTWQCNLNCVYCLEKPIKGVKRENLDLKKVKKIFEFIDTHLIDTKEKTISLTGGEPLLIRNNVVVSKILEEGKKRDFKFHITTNGTMLKEYSDLLLKKYKDDISRIRVTVDGPKEIHNDRRPFLNGKGSFEKIVEGVNFFLEKDFSKFTIITKFDERNIDYIRNTVEMFKKLGWIDKFTIVFGLVHNYGVNIGNNFLEKRKNILRKMIKFFEDYPQLIDVIKFDDGCGSLEIIKNLFFKAKLPKIKYFNCNGIMLQNVITFAPEGKIYPCTFFAMYDMHPVGNYINPYLDIEIISRLKKRNVFNLKKCHDCKFLLICGGGCPFKDSIKGNIDLFNTSCLQKDLMENEISEFFFKMRKQKEVNKDE